MGLFTTFVAILVISLLANHGLILSSAEIGVETMTEDAAFDEQLVDDTATLIDEQFADEADSHIFDDEYKNSNATEAKGKSANARQSASRDTFIPTEDEIRAEYERELKARQSEARRLQRMRERRIESANAVKRTLHASSTDSCDWKANPLSIVKGEVCGSHYKVLGLNRRSEQFDKSQVKKAFRKMSLSLHPDKNPSEDAQTAFEIIQNAYDCILDDSCREEYDESLAVKEEKIYWERHALKEKVITKTTAVMKHAHYYVSYAANNVYQLGMQFWDIAGEWRITVFDEEYPVGRPIAVLALLWKGQFLLKLHMLSYLVVRINYEIAKAKGWI